MELTDFDYELPERLIASEPLSVRSQSRLLIPREKNPHQHFEDILAQFKSGDVLVLNNTKVMKARLYGTKTTGGKVELLIERLDNEQKALAHVKANKSPKPGTIIQFTDNRTCEVIGRRGDLFLLKTEHNWYDMMSAAGHMPLPHYMQREANAADENRYQTVFAKHLGAVAAPTAGLHMTPQLLAAIQAKGVSVQEITLHVGAGTFQPVRTDKITEHKMHAEWIDVQQEVVDVIQTGKSKGGRVFALGTTTLRSLEAAAQTGELKAFKGDTDIFIYPGFKFNVVDKLITNFHLPKSTLLMLVAAFAGYDLMMSVYHEAIKEEYRFYSYGDAMLLTRDDNAV